MKAFLLAAMSILGGCQFVEHANEAKAVAKVNLTFPFQAIGLNMLPDIVLGVGGGFEWHSDEDAHRREIELMKARAEIAKMNLDPTTTSTILAGSTPKAPDQDLEQIFLHMMGK